MSVSVRTSHLILGPVLQHQMLQDMGGMGDLLDFDGTASAPVAAAPAAPTYSQPSPPPQDDLGNATCAWLAAALLRLKS